MGKYLVTFSLPYTYYVVGFLFIIIHPMCEAISFLMAYTEYTHIYTCYIRDDMRTEAMLYMVRLKAGHMIVVLWIH
jgi:hypothetical protein